MITCLKCGKENQDHYKFCLGCGAELPRNAAHQPKSFTAPTPPSGLPHQGGGGSGLNRPPFAGQSSETPLAPALNPSGASGLPLHADYSTDLTTQRYYVCVCVCVCVCVHLLALVALPHMHMACITLARIRCPTCL